MNFLNLYQEVSASFTTTVTPRAKVWLNAAYHEFLTYRRWSFLETTSAAVPLVASQQNYVLTGTSPVIPDFAGMISVELEQTAAGSRVPMHEMDAQTFVDCVSTSRVNGVPVFWTATGGTPAANSAAVLAGGNTSLAVWPIPLATAGNGVNLFIRYDRSAASIELSADTDIPIIAAQHHFALVHGANAIGYETFNQPDLANQQRQLFERRMERAAREDMSMRMRDLRRVQFVQQPFSSPQARAPQPGEPVPSDPYPARH